MDLTDKLVINKDYITIHGQIVTFIGLQDNPAFGFFTCGPDTFFGLHLSLIVREAI